MTTSFHYTRDRREREELINEIGAGNPIGSFIVDKGHPKGPELHEVRDTGVVFIYNYYSKKLVTKLIARPAQLARYYGKGNVPQKLWNLAKEHQSKGYNEV